MPNFSVPFMSQAEDGRQVINLYHDGQAVVNELEADWTGVATGGGANRFWYIGNSYGERSFSRLAARNYEAALREAAPIALNERLEGHRASFDSFTKAIYDQFEDHPGAVTKLLSDVKLVDGLDAIRMFSAPTALSVEQKEKMHLLQGLQRQFNDPSLGNRGVDALMRLTEKKTELENQLIRSFVENHTLVGLQTTSSNRNRQLLSKCPEHEGEWRVTVFTPDGEPIGHSNYSTKAQAVHEVVRNGHYAQDGMEVHCAPFRETDYAFVNGDETYLIVDRVPAGKEISALLQTIAVSDPHAVVGQDVKNALVNTVDGWKQCPSSSIEFKIYNDAFHRTMMSHDSAANKVDLMFAYAVESAVSHGVKPSFHTDPASAPNWLAEVRSIVENFYETAAGLSYDEIEPQDLVNFAYIMAHLDVPEIGVQIQEIMQKAREDVRERALGGGVQAFGYYVNLNERGSFYADVRNADGSTVFEVRGGRELGEDDTSMVEDGYMTSYTDVDGLRDFLVNTGVIPEKSAVFNSGYFEQVLEQQSAAKDRFTAPSFDMR